MHPATPRRRPTEREPGSVLCRRRIREDAPTSPGSSTSTRRSRPQQVGETPAADEADLVINVVDEDDAKPFRRKSRGTFVVGLYERNSHSLPEDYPMLVRALANIALCYVPGEGAWFTTMERGHYGDTAEQGERPSRGPSSSGSCRWRARSS